MLSIIGFSYRGRHNQFLVCVALFCAGFLPGFAAAQANFSEPGLFVVTVPCSAYTSFRKLTGATVLELNRGYFVHAENRRVGGSHALLEVAGERKWVKLECGNYLNGRPPFKGDDGGASRKGEMTCLPFFDTADNPVEIGSGRRVDISPVPPGLDGFDRAVNTLCGEPGKRTSRQEFRQLLEDNPQLVAELFEFTGGKVFHDRPRHTERADYLADLTEAWYAVRGFDHIFCGEPSADGSVGGLHYAGRYLQLQESGELCRSPDYQSVEVVEGRVYTMGVRMNRDGTWLHHATKGYGLSLSAADILKIATRAFAENPTDSSSSAGCILKVSDDGIGYTTVFVRRSAGIRTFYPDATPDLSRNPGCTSPVELVPLGKSG